MELSRLLKFYEKKIGQEISSDDHFLLKYKSDKKNSVFKKEDFEALKKDLQEAAKLDFDGGNIAPSELLRLYNNKVDKKNKEYSLDNFYYKIYENVEESEQTEQQPLESPIEQLIKEEESLEQINDEKLKKYTQHKIYGNIISSIDLKNINKLDEKALKRFDDLLNSMPNNVEDDGLSLFAQMAEILTDENIDFAKNLINKGLSAENIIQIFSNKDFNKETELLLNKTINLILNNNTEKFQEQYSNVIAYKSNFIAQLFEDSKTTNNFKTFLSKYEKDLNSDTISEVLDICVSKDFSKAMELLEYRNIKEVDSTRIEEVLAFEGEAYNIATEIFANPEYDKLNIDPLVSIPPEKREKIKDFVNTIDEHDFSWELEDICQLNDEELEKLKGLSNTKFNGELLNTKTIIQLAKEPEEIIEKIKNYKNKNSKIENEVLLFILTSNDPKLEKFIKENSKYEYKVNMNKKTLDISTPKDTKEEVANEEFMRYSQHTKSFETVTNTLETHSSQRTILNKQERKQQNIEYERIPSGYGDRKSIIKRQEIKTFDKNNNLSKTELYELSPSTGLPNITETDANGNQKVLQQTSVDKYGNLKITKDFTSQNGTRTEYQLMEDSIGNRRSIHKITDKNGNVLLDKTLSLKMLSENKFISTENGRSLEIEYTDDEIIITNPETKKSSTISIKDKIKPEDRDRVLKLLKTMSAEQLLIMNIGQLNAIEIYSTNFTDGENTNNGSWNLITKAINIGESTFPKNQREYLQRSRHVLLHEYGHFIDFLAKDLYGKDISQIQSLKNIFKKEYTEFRKTATIEEEKFIEYMAGTKYSYGMDNGGTERCAESNMIVNGITDSFFAMRGYYLERHFPESIAANIKEIEKIEQLALEKSGLL